MFYYIKEFFPGVALIFLVLFGLIIGCEHELREDVAAPEPAYPSEARSLESYSSYGDIGADAITVMHDEHKFIIFRWSGLDVLHHPDCSCIHSRVD